MGGGRPAAAVERLHGDQERLGAAWPTATGSTPSGGSLGNGRSHTMAILTRSPQGFRHGKETINGLSTIVYDALALPLAPE